MPTCSYCGREVALPFFCSSCGREFCVEHRLPELHGCCRPGRKLLSGLRQVRPRGPTALSYAYGSGRVGRTSATEIKHILAAAGLFFAVELSSYLFLIYTPIYLLTLLLGVLVAFLIHEYAHKLAAQTYGYWAEFRLSRIGAILSLISIVSPLKIIAPGAVMIYGQFAAREDVGRIAAAGPLTNVLQSIIATLISTFARQPTTMIVGIIVASLNADLALFNLIPFAVMDGKKVFDWNRAVWLILFASAIALWAYVRFLSSPF